MKAKDRLAHSSLSLTYTQQATSNNWLFGKFSSKLGSLSRVNNMLICMYILQTQPGQITKRKLLRKFEIAFNKSITHCTAALLKQLRHWHRLLLYTSNSSPHGSIREEWIHTIRGYHVWPENSNANQTSERYTFAKNYPMFNPIAALQSPSYCQETPHFVRISSVSCLTTLTKTRCLECWAVILHTITRYIQLSEVPDAHFGEARISSEGVTYPPWSLDSVLVAIRNRWLWAKVLFVAAWWGALHCWRSSGGWEPCLLHSLPFPLSRWFSTKASFTFLLLTFLRPCLVWVTEDPTVVDGSGRSEAKSRMLLVHSPLETPSAGVNLATS